MKAKQVAIACKSMRAALRPNQEAFLLCRTNNSAWLCDNNVGEQCGVICTAFPVAIPVLTGIQLCQGLCTQCGMRDGAWFQSLHVCGTLSITNLRPPLLRLLSPSFCSFSSSLDPSSRASLMPDPPLPLPRPLYLKFLDRCCLAALFASRESMR